MTGAVLAALWGQWRRAPLHLATLVLGLALATALWSGVQAINAEARASYAAAAATLGEGRYDQIVARDGGPLTQADYIALRRAGWQVSPVLDGAWPTDQGRLRLVGLEPLTLPEGLRPVSPEAGGDLQAFVGQRLLFANAATAALLTQVPGRVVIDPTVAPGTVLADIGAAQQLLDRPGEVSRLIVAEAQPLGRPPLAEIAPHLLRRAGTQGTDIARLTDSFHLNLTAFGLLAFAVGLFIVQGAVGLTFEARRPLVRSLRALGVPIRWLVALMLAEVALLALVAGALGIALGYVFAAALLPDVAATLEGLYGAQVSGGLALRPVWWLSGLAMALVGALGASARALWLIARMPPLASARPRAWAMASGRGQRRLAGGGLLLWAGAAGLALWPQGLIGGFVLLAGLMLGAALMLPLGLSTLLSRAEARAKGPRAQWFWADTRQQVPGLSLALMALLLAMAANIGVSTMVSSFRVTFTGFLDQRLLADLYVRVEDPADGPRLDAFAAPRATVLPIASIEAVLEGQPSQIYSARLGPAYAQNWRLLQALPEAWEVAARGDGVIINEQLARRAGLRPGDALDLGGGVHLPVAGVVGDYGNPIGQAIVSEPVFASLAPGVRPHQYGLITDDPAALRHALTSDLGLAPGEITDQAAIKRLSLEIFERTFTVTGALNVLTLAVAGFALLMSLLTLAALRLPQLAPVWALGLTRAELARLEVGRSVILAALTGALALPLGLALAWVLLAVVNVAAFGWRLPMALFPGDYLRLGLWSLLAAGLAALWPAWRLSRIPPRSLLGVFANER